MKNYSFFSLQPPSKHLASSLFFLLNAGLGSSNSEDEKVRDTIIFSTIVGALFITGTLAIVCLWYRNRDSDETNKKQETKAPTPSPSTLEKGKLPCPLEIISDEEGIKKSIAIDSESTHKISHVLEIPSDEGDYKLKI